MLFIIALPLLNGPIFRLVAGKVLSGYAEKHGLDHEATISGTIWGGPSITDFSLTPISAIDEGRPSSPIQSLQAGEIAVRYSALDVLRGDPFSALDKLTLKDVSLDLVLPDRKNAKPTEPADPERRPFDWDRLWGLASSEFEIKNTSVQITKGKNTTVVEAASLELLNGQGSLSVGNLSLPGGRSSPGFTAPVTATTDRLAIGDGIELLEDVRLRSLELHRKKSPVLQAKIEAGGGLLAVDCVSRREFGLALESGAIDTGIFFPENPPVSTTIRTLEATFAGDLAIPSSWSAKASAATSPVSGQASAETLVFSFDATPAKGLEGTVAITPTGGSGFLDLKVETPPLGDDLASLRTLPAQLDFAMDLPSVSDLAPILAEAASKAEILGGLKGEGTVELSASQMPTAGSGTLSTLNLAHRGRPVGQVSLRYDVPETGMLDLSARADVDAENQLTLTGRYDLAEKRYSEASGKAALAGSPALNRLIGRSITGDCVLRWSGSGDLGATPTHQGDLQLTARALQLSPEASPLGIELSGSYRPEEILARRLSLQSGRFRTDLEGSYRPEEAIISLTSLTLDEGDRRLLSGQGRIPYARGKVKSIETFFDQSEPMQLKIDGQPIPLSALALLAGRKAIPVEGTLKLDVDLEGTPRDPVGDGKLVVDGIRHSKVSPEIAPARVEGGFDFKPGNFSAQFAATHPRLEPLTAEVRLPFHPQDWANGSRPLVEEPLQAHLILPRTKLDFVSEFVPEVTRCEGSAMLDVKIGGTLGSPTLEGLADLAFAHLTFDNPAAPSLRDTRVIVRGTPERVEIERFSGLAAGGKFEVTGGATLAKGSTPVMDLSFVAQEALITRTSDLNVRSDADLTLTGPWEKAHLAGRIALVNSRYFRNLRIVPSSIRLPGRGAQLPGPPKQAKAHPDLKNVGLKIAPFQDWTLDVAIVTKEPFLVRSNLATADVASDLRITGTGGAPIPSGTISTSRAALTLPFTRVRIERGEARFSEQTGFNPRLDVKATSKVNKTTIDAYLYGPALSPTHVLTSNPPLTEEDIISLVSTGSTRSQLLSSGGSEAATKAALLVFRSLQSADTDRDGEPSLFEELESRTTFQAGSTNARTGEHTATGEVRLWKQLYVEAGADTGSSLRGVLKYLFRFE